MPENINKKDLDVILEVNRKAIELEMERVDLESERVEQNEKIIGLLNKNLTNNEDTEENLESKLEEILVSTENLETKMLAIEKDLFKIQVVFLSGIISLIIQIIQLFKK